MNKQAPTPAQILTMVAFGVSCFGLVLFLWLSFGGSTPLAGQGYRFTTEFDQAVELANESDVRISGVSVGKVVSHTLDRRTGLTKAIINIDPRYAPRPLDTRATLRSKSLLGETFVELTPGSAHGPQLPDGGTLAQSHVAPTVQLDQILSTFDPTTRQAFRTWQQQDGIALTNRGQDLNAAFAALYPFATNVESVLSVLRRDSAATSTLLRDGGQVFSALSSSPTKLQGFVRNSDALFSATAAQNAALAGAIRAFPAFTDATRLTVDRVRRFSANAQPLIDELRPAAVQLSPALQASAVLAPKLRDLLVDVGPLTRASKRGIPALMRFLDFSEPFLARLKPYLGNFVPVFNYINSYRRELTAFFANSAATTQAVAQNDAQTATGHYLRIANPVNPEVLTSYGRRLSSNRANPYLQPGAYSLAGGLPVFGSYLCTGNPQPSIGSTIPTALADVLRAVYFTKSPGGPPCKSQKSLGTATTGQSQVFPHLKALP